MKDRGVKLWGWTKKSDLLSSWCRLLIPLMLFLVLGNNIRLLSRRGGRHRFMLEEAQDDDGMSSCGHDDDMSALEGDPRAALIWATARLLEVREITRTPSLMIMLLMRIRASTLPPWTRIPMSRLYQFAATSTDTG